MEETQLLSWLVPLCVMICLMMSSNACVASNISSQSTRMQKAYDKAKTFALSLPASPLAKSQTFNPNDPLQKSPMTDGESSEKCFTAIDLSKDVMPCDKSEKTLIDDDADDKTSNESPDKIFIFVSLSLPMESLKQLARDATTHNAVLILRGLKENSFKETVDGLKEMVQGGEGDDSKGFEGDFDGGFEINPMLFETYHITHVPVFIHVKNDQEQARLSGNVTLPFASQKLIETDIREKP